MKISPDFLVIGAYKSGTTTLHYLLEQHPQLFVPRYKEPSFFAAQGGAGDRPEPAGAVRTSEEYEALFRLKRPTQLAGEVSPEYMPSDVAANRIHAAAPDVKLVAILRNPIERAYSDYLMYVRDGRERAEFMVALEEQDARRERRDPTGYYISTGLYGAELARYYERFAGSQIRIYLFEELRSDEVGVAADIFRFLGVKPDFVPRSAVDQNPSGIPPNRVVKGALRSVRPKRHDSAWRRWVKARAAAPLNRTLKRPPLPPQARQRLAEVFRDDIAWTERLTGRSLSHWLNEV